MRGHKRISILLIIAFIAASSGCSSIPDEHKGAATGAGIGAATGAVAGVILGGGTKGAVIGGLLGALVGGAVGHYTHDTKKTQNETAETYNYEPSQGTVLTIEEASASPRSLQAGQTVDLKMTYAVMSPSADMKTTITEIREITLDGELVGRPEVRVEHSGGTYTSTIPLRLPADAKKGTYKVKVTIESENAKDTRETNFVVS